MIEIKIGLDGIPSIKKINIGNQWENNDEVIHFILPNSFDNYYKYVIAVHEKDLGNSLVFPLEVGNILKIKNSITCKNGKWYLYLLCRDTEMDSEKIVDIINDDHIFIADVFFGIINKNYIKNYQNVDSSNDVNE